MMAPGRKVRVAAIVAFVLATAAGNLLSPFTPVWIAGVFAVAISTICGLGMVYCVVWSQTGELGQWGGAGGVAFFCLIATGSVVLLPPELDPGAMELAAIFGNESIDRQASIAKASQKALQLPDHEGRQTAARGVYLLSGIVISFRDERDETKPFVPDDRARKLVEAALTTQANVKDAIDDHVRGSFSRSVVKLLSILAFVTAACGSTLTCAGQREKSLKR
jgi:hypothetical protein